MDEEDDVLQQLKTKMENYFKSKKYIQKKEDLDDFLKAIDLLEVWDTDEEKELVWQCLNKYNKKGRIDYNAAINGIKDLINQEDEQETTETFLVRLSRSASVRERNNKGKVSIHKLTQTALDEYECIDNDTLLQLKKIISMLKVNKDSNRIYFSKIQDICAENKSIKMNPEEVWKYMSFMSTDNNSGNANMPMTLHHTIFNEIERFINEKVPYDEQDNQIEDNNIIEEKEEDIDDQDPLDVIDAIINNSESIQEDYSNSFTDMTKSLTNLTDNMVEKAQNILNGNDDNLEEVLFVKDLMLKKINELNQHNKKIAKEQDIMNKKMIKVQFYINKRNSDYQNLEEDYKILNEKYENNQKTEKNNDEEVERLFGENLMLSQDKETKEKEIKNLNKEKTNLENQYNKILAQLQQSLNKNKEMENEINDVKAKALKFKEEYDDTLQKLVNLEKTYQEMLKKEEKEERKEEEDDNEIEMISGTSTRPSQGKIPIMMDPRKSQSRTIFFESEENEELTKNIKELEKMNEILKEKNKESTMKIKELETIISKGYKVSSMTEIKRTESYNSMKLNEIFHPSLYEIFNERICLMSQLSNFNPKKIIIVKKYTFSIGKPSKKKAKNLYPLLSQESNVINYRGLILKKLQRKQTFNNEINIVSSNSSFNIQLKEKELPKKPKIILEIIHNNDFNIINTIKKLDAKEYKISKNSFNIIKKISINDPKKNNSLFNELFSGKKILKKDSIKKSDKEEKKVSFGPVKDFRSNTIMINPKDLLENKDYYCLTQEDYVKRKLAQLGDNCFGKDIYSDKIFVLVERKSILKKYILLTASHFCIIEQNTLKFVYVDKIKNIKNIVLSKLNLNLILFRFLDGEDLLIESLRAYDLISFMKSTYYSNIKTGMFRYEDKFIIKLKGQLHSLCVTDKILTNLINLDGALKVGYLSLYKETFLSSNFIETIGVLTNIGLILLEEATLKPLTIIPILGSISTKVEKERFGNNNCFEIILPSGVTKVLAVRKSRERESWLAQFTKMKKELEEKMRKIGATRRNSFKILKKLKGGK